nr:nucleotidyltransferase family protein [Echinimonas agarilytica]
MLAAGRGSRFQSIKQLAMLNEQLLVNRQLGFYCRFQRPLYLVLGAYQAQIEAQIEPKYLSDITIVSNPDWALGMGHSISQAMAYITTHSNYSHALIALLDQPCITQADIELLMAQSHREPDSIISAGYAEQTGVPAIFPAQQFHALQSLQGDVGAKKIIHKSHHKRIVDMPNAAFDIDTQQQLNEIRNSLC